MALTNVLDEMDAAFTELRNATSTDDRITAIDNYILLSVKARTEIAELKDQLVKIKKLFVDAAMELRKQGSR